MQRNVHKSKKIDVKNIFIIVFVLLVGIFVVKTANDLVSIKTFTSAKAATSQSITPCSNGFQLWYGKRVACAKALLKDRTCPPSYIVYDQTTSIWDKNRCRTLTSIRDGYFKNIPEEQVDWFETIRRGNELCRYVTNNSGAECLNSLYDASKIGGYFKEGTRCPILLTIGSQSNSNSRFPYLTHEGTCYKPPMK